MSLFLILFFVLNILIFFFSLKKAKADQFFTDTHILGFIGIYVWGDGLALAPFWAIFSFIFLVASQFYNIGWINLLSFYILFMVIRSIYEVFYWLNHQSVKSTYKPPLFRKIEWLDAEKSAILYQLLHTCVVVGGIAILFVLQR